MSVHDRPDPHELAEAVREFLEREILPVLEDPRLRFRALVAANALGILERQLRELPPRRDDWQLARRIRTGEVPEGALAEVREQVEAKLRVASPRYLERYDL